MERPYWKNKRLRRMTVAAATTALIGLGIWWLIHSRTASSIVQTAKADDILAPMRTRAFLTLSKGQQVGLDGAATGALAFEGAARIIKASNGEVVYQVDPSTPGELLYNTLDNPRGSIVIDVTLSDGTRVWLNAGSSIRYPAIFPAYDRTVEVNGEAYFEVASDAHRPFGVKSGNTLVRVLGTALNIKAAGDPRLRITLLEGEARITAGNTLTLEAGQQAVVEDRVELVKDINIDGVMAWKKGLFSFSHTDLITVMRELSRWYDVDIIYQKNPPNRYFTGVLDRTLPLDEVLKTLTDKPLHYTINSGSRELTIAP